jgi:hypothetical protein
LIIAALTLSAAHGHHSVAGIAQDKIVTHEGTVRQFKWANPHSWLEIEVLDSKGGIEIWNLEMTAPAALIRAGWKATSVKAGDVVKFSARPLRSGDPGGLFVSITLPSGQTLTQQGPRLIEQPRAAAPEKQE